MATEKKYSDPRPSVQDLEAIAGGGQGVIMMPSHSCDEVYPNIVVGDMSTALNRSKLQHLGITHVVNCAQGKTGGHVNTTEAYYKDTGIQFYAIKANDITGFDIMPFLEPAAEYIDQALNSGGKVLVHCCEGFSRAPTVVTSYLMLRKNMDVRDALEQVRSKREVCPNQGFMKILSELNAKLDASRK